MDAMRKILIHLGDHTSDEAQPLTLFLARMTVDRNGTPKPKSLRQLPTSLKQLTITNVATNNQQTIAKPDSATFMLLPLEIRQKIFDILFGELRKEAGFSTSLTCSGSNFTCVDCSQSSGLACDVHAHELHICIPEDIEQLFVSVQWYLDALPVFARATSIDTTYFTVFRLLTTTSN